MRSSASEYAPFTIGKYMVLLIIKQKHNVQHNHHNLLEITLIEKLKQTRLQQDIFNFYTQHFLSLIIIIIHDTILAVFTFLVYKFQIFETNNTSGMVRNTLYRINRICFSHSRTNFLCIFTHSHGLNNTKYHQRITHI